MNSLDVWRRKQTCAWLLWKIRENNNKTVNSAVTNVKLIKPDFYELWIIIDLHIAWFENLCCHSNFDLQVKLIIL